MPQFVVPPEGISFKDVITDFEKRLIESTLEAAGGVQKRAAELLHIKPTTLNEMIKRYEIRPRRKRRSRNGVDRPRTRRPFPDRVDPPTVVGLPTPTGSLRRQVTAARLDGAADSAEPLRAAVHDVRRRVLRADARLQPEGCIGRKIMIIAGAMASAMTPDSVPRTSQLSSR